LKRYIVRFEGNNSRKWDGKEVYIDREVLNELYDSTELVHGAKVLYLWKGKAEKITHWNSIFVDPAAGGSVADGSSATSGFRGENMKTTTTGSARQPSEAQKGNGL